MVESTAGKLRAEEAQERTRLAALYQLEILDTRPERPFHDVVEIAAALCDVPIAIISFVDAERQWGAALVGLESSEAPWAAAFCAQTITSPGGVLIIPDTLKDPRRADRPEVVGQPRPRFYAGVAIVTDEGHALGSIGVADNTRPRELDDRTLRALEALARQTAILVEIREQSIKLAAAYRQLRSLAISDPLTNLVNRTFLEHSLELALRRRQRSGRPLGVLFGDVDGLKAVNDAHGHQAGDALLQSVSARLTAAARAADLVCRFGGDEFVVMCPDLTAQEDLATIAQRLSVAVAGPMEVAGQRIQPRLSIGRALAADDDDARSLLQRADAEMYRAKRGGR